MNHSQEMPNEADTQQDWPQSSTQAPPPLKKLRSTLDLDAPGLTNYEDIWTSSELSEEDLKSPGALFGSQRSWFVREAYVSLYDEIMDDNEKITQIVNGSAGIGKSAFLLYILARQRSAAKPKSVLLHFHRNENETAATVFFPANGHPIKMSASHPHYFDTFMGWYKKVGEEESLLLVDGVVSFTKDDVLGVKYIAAKSPSCSIGFMEKYQNRRDRWLDFWSREELLQYANLTGIPNAENVISGNFFHIGGISRYAFQPMAAREAIMTAISQVGATELFKVVETKLASKYNQQKLVDRLIHRHPPAGKIGVYGTTYTFASEFVATRVAMALSLEKEIETTKLLHLFKGVGPAGSMRGVLFEAYAARKLATGGSFTVKAIGSEEIRVLELSPTDILQKDTMVLNKTNYPTKEIEEKGVWPNPDYNMPAIDVFMVRSHNCTAIQMTVGPKHGHDLKGTKAFLKYFDSIRRDLKEEVPPKYPLYVAVPTDVFVKFSKSHQPITGENGIVLTDTDSKNTGNRLEQFIMKIE